MRKWHYQPARDVGLPPAARATSLVREPTLFETVLHHASWEIIRGCLVLHQHLRVMGSEFMPRASPFVLVANHASHLDALVLGSMMPRRLRGEVFALAAADTFFATPVLATLSASLLNALPLWRDHGARHGLESLRRRLVEDQGCLILFPEGTRTRTGLMGTFKPGIGVLVAGTEVPVIPCHIRGAFESWPAQSSRPRRGRITVRVGSARSYPRTPDTRVGWTEVAADLESAVRGLALGFPIAQEV
jgi:1-acyl-sn-glycerol-3-phosphate acyltransferase